VLRVSRTWRFVSGSNSGRVGRREVGLASGRTGRGVRFDEDDEDHVVGTPFSAQPVQRSYDGFGELSCS
jgi:hypothetical protein